MLKTYILFSLLIIFSISINAQVFKQDFSASNTVSDYVSSVPDLGEFSEISNSPEVVTSITNGRLRFHKTAVGTSYFYRTPSPDLTPEPTFIQMKFDFEVSNNDPSHPDNRRNIPFYFGPSYNAQGASVNSSFCTFGLNISAVDGNFFLTVEPGGTTSTEFSGKQSITFVANKTGSTQTYTAPNATTESIANNKWEIWVGNTKVFDDVSARKPELSFGSFKMQYNSFLPIATLDFDNFEFKDFLHEYATAPPTQSLVHPHIWVSPSDRQGILDNIANHAWASSLFNQLKTRQSSLKTSHSSNPAAILNQIPEIPGDRTNHRNRLNSAAESAFLYYLTGDEDYAQISADILNHYVKLLSVQDPLTFEFYTGSFNHLIPPRELFPRVAMIYDFVQPYLSKQGTTVYDLDSGTRVPFNFATSQKAFEVMADNVILVGGNNSNHPVLELPGGLYSVLSMEDDAIRAAYFDKLLNGKANSRQPGMNWMLDRFSDGDRLWPESTGYAKFTHSIFLQALSIADNYKPELNLIDDNKDLLESIFIYENFLYPNGATMAYGDIGRTFNDHSPIFRNILAIADRNGYTDLKERAASTLKKIYTAAGGYVPVIEDQRLEWNNPLQLLWGVHIDDSVSGLGEPQYGTVTATHAGVVMQRNFVETDNEQYGLMYYTGGGTYVHAHATGLDMEFYGAGYVIGPDHGGDAGGYGTTLHEEYAVSHAAHNTIIVNGTTKRGVPSSGTWDKIVDPIVLQASEPKVKENPIAENFSFSTQFLDDNINNLDQQRTNSIIRTSATSGYYVDIFRSVSNTTNNFHDYLFHGLGDVMKIKTGDALLALTNTPNRYPVASGTPRNQPGWQYYTNPKTSALTSNAITARFDLMATNAYLHVSVPGGVEKEYSSALAPPTEDVKNGYDKKDTQMFIMRKYGEAWDQPFIAIYEPSGNAESTVKETSTIFSNNKVVGVEVTSEVGGQKIVDIILSNPDNQGVLNLSEYDLSFSGRFGIVRVKVVNNKTNVSLYIGEGNQLTFNGETLNSDNEDKGFLEYTLDYKYKFSPKADNFTIRTVGESCFGEKNGLLQIAAKEENDYTVTFDGNSQKFTTDVTFDDLEPGQYNLCISIDGDDFEQCYQLVIEEGRTLSGKIDVKKNTANVSLNSGGGPYAVFKNGSFLYETELKEFSVEVRHGDKLEVKANEACQGSLAKAIDLMQDVKTYPNPTKGNFEMYLSDELDSVYIETYNIHSQLISSGRCDLDSGKILLNIEDKPNGIYFVKVHTEKPVFVKVIKE
ncbi:T9SS type A sorting domain-containing protein [Bacteroidota bacterium]